jgi:hypothetical protein
MLLTINRTNSLELIMSRLFLTKVHLWLAALLFPAMILFLVTGGLYTWGITGKTVDSKLDVALTAPLDPENEAALRDLARTQLALAGLEEPSGKARVRQSGGGFAFEWSGSRRDITIEPTADPLVAKVTVKEASLHRTMVQLHKGKGGVLFKIYATILAAALFLLIATGLIIGLKSPPFRRATIVGSGAGLVVFLGLVLAS